MKRKGILSVFILIAFLAVTIFSVSSIFVVKDINLDLTLSKAGESYSENVKKDLDEFLNKNLLFLKKGKIEETLKKYPYLEIKSLKKAYPNKIEIIISERQEVCFIKENGENYILDGSGFVLSKTADERKGIVEITGVKVNAASIGGVISVSETDLLNQALKTICSDYYINNIKKIQIVKATEKSDIIFHMSTGVEIEVWNALTRGEEKIKLGLTCYDTALSDYDKYKDYVLVFEKADGALQVTHTPHNSGN